MKTGEIIKQLRIDHGMTQQELADLMGYKHKSSINKLESGKASLTQDKITLLSKIFNVKTNEILGDYQKLYISTPISTIFPAKENDRKEPNQYMHIIGNSKVVPVLGRVVAGIPTDAVEEIIDYEEISEAMASQGEFFALQVKGDSMSPKFTAGDVVIVRKQEDVDNGDIAIMLINGDEATIKRVQKFNGGINLIPTNQAYPILTYTNKEIEELPVRCLGKVVELRAKF